ncbi:hypothetical protein ABXT64_02935 [Candidatus Marifrigoribacter sp. Uisw_064]|uniref:hypothetical protein n=1 Tax=Candidatus Marifrigoribacter sp. Uisw_064 TaxID=3230970 RepID=UPI003D5464B5
MKKLFLLLFASVLVLSCTKDVELADSSADLSATLAQYDDTNMGVYKGVFTTQGTLERGILEINITPNNVGVATLKLTSGQKINFIADRTIEAGAEVQNLAFSSSSIMASFKLSADLDGANVQISDVVYKGITSGAIAAHETSRAPVVPITGVLACDDCDVHPFLETGDTGTFSIVFVGDGTGDDSVNWLADVGGVVNGTGNQASCTPIGAQMDCVISGGITIGANVVDWNGIHTYNTSSDCSDASGTWSLASGNYGNFTGTFTSDVTCAPAAPANDTCATAEAAVCGGSYTGNTDTATDEDGFYGPDVWYSLTGLVAGAEVTVSLCGGLTTYDSRLVIYDACGGVELFNLDDSCGLQSEIIYTTDGSDVLVSVQAFSAGTGNYGLDITCTSPPGADCEQEILTNAFDNARGYNVQNSWVVANDVIVAADENFDLTQIVIESFNGPGAVVLSADVSIYSDVAGIPGALLSTETLAPTSEVNIGSNFGLDVNEVTFDLTQPTLLGQAGTTTTYWVAVQVSNSDAGTSYWGFNAAAAPIGVGHASSGDNGATWILPGGEGVYVFLGTCSPIPPGQQNTDRSTSKEVQNKNMDSAADRAELIKASTLKQ